MASSADVSSDVRASEIAIPLEVLRKWQGMVDLVATIVHVPSAVITKLEPPHYTHYRVIVSSDSPGNPFPADELFSMEIGTFCETVIKSRHPLLVSNALDDDQWKSAPEIQVGMVSYLGLPVAWPDGRMFGTICVLDDKANQYNDAYQALLTQCRDVLEADLRTVTHLGGELEEQRAHLTQLFARVPEAVVMVDRDCRITRINPEFTNIFGFTAQEATGRRIQELITPSDLQEDVDRFIDRMVRTGEVFAAETVRISKTGRRIPVFLTCVPVSSNAAGPIAYLIYRDLTETKRLEGEQRRFHEMQLDLAHANRVATIAQLSASIAHELNQPLTGMITNCSTSLRMLMADAVNLEEVRDAVGRAIRDGHRAADVVARLRALFSKKELASELVDLNEAAREVIGLMSADLQNSRLTVRIELAEDLRCVVGDRVQLQQVIMNMLRNALDAMKTVNDRPRELLIRSEREDGDQIRFSVKDTGVGFDPEKIDKLFEPFYSTKKDGMGVGLSVSRSIVENHQGRLWTVLNDGPGATFSFAIPCRE